MVIVTVDYENCSAWWDHARQRADVPSALRPLLEVGGVDAVEVEERDLAPLLAWCRGVPGWDDGPSYARHPLRVLRPIR